MAKFKVNRSDNFTVMSNHHLRNRDLSLKAKGLLSQMLSLPPDWDYTLKGLACINKEKIDAIRTAIWELEKAGYIKRYRERDSGGRLLEMVYEIYELPQEDCSRPDDEDYCIASQEDFQEAENPKALKNKDNSPELENPTLVENDNLFTECSLRLDFPTLEKPTLEKPTLENPTQINKDILNKDIYNIYINNKRETDVNTSNLITSNLDDDEIRLDESPAQSKRASPGLDEIREKLKKTTCYEFIIHDFPSDRHLVEEIIEIMTETLIRCEKEDEILVSRFNYPSGMVRERLYSLNEEHIKYVIDSMRNNNSKIRNIKKYLLAALFNAPSTMHNYTAAEVHRDMLDVFKQDD